MFDKWMNGIAYEIAFWNNVYRWSITFNGMMKWSGFGSVIQLEQFDANSFLKASKTRKILDVGSGMSYATGDYIQDNGKETKLDIHYIDPLAPYFNKILNRYHRNLPQIEFGMVEYLSAFYPNHDTDLIIIQNALDHSANPVKGIIEALDTLRKDGILYLNHHPNEAEVEDYKGFHQYNITQKDNHLIIWNKKEQWDINELTRSFANIQVHVHKNGHVIAVVRKTQDVPTELLMDKEDKKSLSLLMMAEHMNQLNLSAVLRFHLSYWKYNTIQFLVQALPWNIKMKLKKVIGQTAK